MKKLIIYSIAIYSVLFIVACTKNNSIPQNPLLPSDSSTSSTVNYTSDSGNIWKITNSSLKIYDSANNFLGYPAGAMAPEMPNSYNIYKMSAITAYLCSGLNEDNGMLAVVDSCGYKMDSSVNPMILIFNNSNFHQTGGFYWDNEFWYCPYFRTATEIGEGDYVIGNEAVGAVYTSIYSVGFTCDTVSVLSLSDSMMVWQSKSGLLNSNDVAINLISSPNSSVVDTQYVNFYAVEIDTLVKQK